MIAKGHVWSLESVTEAEPKFSSDLNSKSLAILWALLQSSLCQYISDLNKYKQDHLTVHQLNVSTVEPLGKCVQTQCLAVKALGICKKKSCEYEVKSCENKNQMGEGVGGWGIALRTSCISQNKCLPCFIQSCYF